MISLVLSSKTSLLSLKEFVNFAKKVGFEGIDYILPFSSVFNPERRSALEEEIGPFVYSLHQPLLPVVGVPPIFYKQLVTPYSNFKHAKIINYHLSTFFYPLGNGEKNVQKAVALLKKQNVPFSIESNPNRIPLNFYPKETFDPKLFGDFCVKHNLPITLDTSHIARSNTDIIEFFRIYKKNVRMIHLSDYKQGVEHLPLKEGTLPIEKFLQEVKNSSVEVISFEISTFNKKFSKEEKLRQIENSLSLAKNFLK